MNDDHLCRLDVGFLCFRRDRRHLRYRWQWRTEQAAIGGLWEAAAVSVVSGIAGIAAFARPLAAVLGRWGRFRRWLRGGARSRRRKDNSRSTGRTRHGQREFGSGEGRRGANGDVLVDIAQPLAMIGLLDTQVIPLVQLNLGIVRNAHGDGGIAPTQYLCIDVNPVPAQCDAFARLIAEMLALDGDTAPLADAGCGGETADDWNGNHEGAESARNAG